jgi:hypothetical protein
MTYLFVENGDVDDSSFDELVYWKCRCDTTTVENDRRTTTHLGELAPIDFAVSKVALDLVDDRDILQVHATRWVARY